MVGFDGLLVVGAMAFGFYAVEAKALSVEHAHHTTVFQGFAAMVTVRLGEEIVRHFRSSLSWLLSVRSSLHW